MLDTFSFVYALESKKILDYMSQTNWIGAFIVMGFIAYIIARGQLPGYLSVLGLQ